MVYCAAAVAATATAESGVGRGESYIAPCLVCRGRSRLRNKAAHEAPRLISVAAAAPLQAASCTLQPGRVPVAPSDGMAANGRE